MTDCAFRFLLFYIFFLAGAFLSSNQVGELVKMLIYIRCVLPVSNRENEFLIGMRRKSELLKGRCGQCSFKTVCGGCRIRAEVVHGDIWAEDPACYLSDSEIGIG